MTRRMFLAGPSDPLVPEGRRITYLPGGLMVDLSADMRCATCKWWLEDDAMRYCAYLAVSVPPDFGCVKWEQKPSE